MIHFVFFWCLSWSWDKCWWQKPKVWWTILEGNVDRDFHMSANTHRNKWSETYNLQCCKTRRRRRSELTVFKTGFPGPKNLTRYNANDKKVVAKMTIRAIKSSFITFMFFQMQIKKNFSMVIAVKTIGSDMKRVPLSIKFRLQSQDGSGPTRTRK